jgi:hypothetical protein
MVGREVVQQKLLMKSTLWKALYGKHFMESTLWKAVDEKQLMKSS